MALQIKSKFIQDEAIDGDKLKLKSGQAVRLRKADNTEVRLIELDEASGKVEVLGQPIALEAALLQEVQDRIAGDDALDTRLDIIEGPDTQAGSILKALKDAKAYVDDVVGVSSTVVSTFANLSTYMSDGDAATGLINSVGAVRDELDATQSGAGLNSNGSYYANGSANYIAAAVSLKDADNKLDAAIKAEEARALAAEAAEASARQAADSALQSDIDAEEARALAAEAALQSDIDAEEARASGAETALDGRLDVLEARLFRKQKFTLVAQDITNGYVELSLEAMENSIVASVGRLMIHEGVGEDFTVSVVGPVGAKKTRITFVGNLIEPSEEKLEAGDVLYVRYMNV